MKKIKVISMVSILVLILSIGLLITGCNTKNTGDDADNETDNKVENKIVKIGALNGPTMIGLGRLNHRITTEDRYKENYQITKESDEDAIAVKLSNGTYDIAIMPTNKASILYNVDNNVRVLAISVTNVLYLLQNGDQIEKVENDPIATFKNLQGKTIVSAGHSKTPQAVFDYLLQANGVSANVLYQSDATVAQSLFKTNKHSIALLPQPAATAAITGNEHGGKELINLNDVWKATVGDTADIITGVVVTTQDFIDKYTAKLTSFLNDFNDSVTYMKNADNIDNASQYIVDMGIVPALPIAKKALPNCGLSYIIGGDMKDKITAYLTVIKSQNPSLIGTELPKAEFYYNV